MADSTTPGSRKTKGRAAAPGGFSADERAAMQARAAELEAEGRRRKQADLDAAVFGSRYATFGFNDAARLDEGTMWPTSFALAALTPADEARIRDLVAKAVS